MPGSAATLEAALYHRGLRALDRTMHHGPEALEYEDALLRLVLAVAEVVTREDVPHIEFKFEDGRVTARQPNKLVVTAPVVRY
jgi:hypothetical protein